MCLVTSIVYRYSWAGCTYSPLSIMNAADKASPEIRTDIDVYKRQATQSVRGYFFPSFSRLSSL